MVPVSTPAEHVQANTNSGDEGRVRVLFPMPLPKAYDYLVSGGARPMPGDFVRAPFGPRQVTGVVWPEGAESERKQPPVAKLKAIDEVLDTPRLAPEVIDFVTWASEFTMFPLGSVLRLVMRSGDFAQRPPQQSGYEISDAVPVRITPQRQAVLDVASKEAKTAAVLAAEAGVSDAVVRGLEKAGGLRRVEMDPDPPFDAPKLNVAGKTLTEDQQSASQMLAEIVAARQHRTVLIDGVTGSGKTEVYFEAIAAALRDDPEAQVLVMLPEIALTLPFIERIEERFGAPPAPWHSDMTSALRRRTWRRVAEGQARLVVGARSALFLPFKKLRLIIVDEEHDNAYKQEDGVIYQGRDMAVARGARGNFPVLLATATPSLETVVNVDEGRYAACGLPTRATGVQMPDISIVDLRESPPEAGAWLSPRLVKEIEYGLSRNEQTLLFLNRRGYAPLTLCRQCGYKMMAPDSDTMLVEHRFENRLVCHHTGYSIPKPSACPQCNAVDSLHPCGPGVERIFEEAKSRWPDRKIELLSSDAVAGPRAMRDVLRAMEAGDIDILIATQLVAKGHNFPGLTLVGVVDADMGLAGGDLRAAERTYQLMSQVTGRAGRAEKPGRAFLQTHQPEAPVLRALASGDRNSFLAAEAEGRRALGFPPYGRLAAIILASHDEASLREAANALRAAAPNGDGVSVLGPARAPIYRLRGMARMRFLIKTRRDVHLQAYLADWVARVKIPSRVRRTIDINPYSFL